VPTTFLRSSWGLIGVMFENAGCDCAQASSPAHRTDPSAAISTRSPDTSATLCDHGEGGTSDACALHIHRTRALARSLARAQRLDADIASDVAEVLIEGDLLATHARPRAARAPTSPSSTRFDDAQRQLRRDNGRSASLGGTASAWPGHGCARDGRPLDATRARQNRHDRDAGAATHMPASPRT